MGCLTWCLGEENGGGGGKSRQCANRWEFENARLQKAFRDFSKVMCQNLRCLFNANSVADREVSLNAAVLALV
jgi:hypothetical protein